MSFEQFERACRKGNSSKAIRLAGNEFRYHWIAARYGMIKVIYHFKKCGHYIDWVLLAHIAAKWDQLHFARTVVEQRIGSTAWMALNFAAADGNLVGVRYYIEKWDIEPDSTQIIWASENGYPEIVRYIYAQQLTKRFDHERAKRYYKSALEYPTDQYYRDPKKRLETLEWLKEYYENRFLL